MRKNYVYALSLILLSVFFWLGYYLYTEHYPVEYENGTFVQVPEEVDVEKREIPV